ncbi:hypothetical protein [Streptomyces sp. KR80]|uniref:hypothetical protein n=1 Tax=Streptomyces sp. KR80 TaxID=3457426 RepID=UPI003FCEF1F1
MQKHWPRRLTLTGAAVCALLAGSLGVASAGATPDTPSETHTACVKDTGHYKAKVCVMVDATSLGGGVWRVEEVRATVSERETSGNGNFCFYLHGYKKPTDNAIVRDECARHPGGTAVLTHTYNKDVLYEESAHLSEKNEFWDRFTGFISVHVTLDSGGWSRSEVGTPRAELN